MAKNLAIEVITALQLLDHHVLRLLGALFTQAEESGISPVLVCAGQLRAPLYRQLRHEFPRLPVVAYSELGGSVDIQTVGTVGNEPANVA